MKVVLTRLSWPLWLGGLGLIALGLAAYGYALFMPMFWDDVMNFAWLSTHSLNDAIFLRGSDVASYRPIQFTTWKLMYLLMGRYEPISLHALNVGLHLVNGLLLLRLAHRLARRLSQSWPMAMAAALLFVLFPFGFQAVVPINALSYPLVMVCMLLGLLAWASGRTGLAIIACLIAPLCHETGLTLVGMLVALSVCGFAPKQSRWVWLMMIAATLVGAWLWSQGAAGDAQFGQMLLGLFSRSAWNSAYFAQALAFPFAHLAGRLFPAGAEANPANGVLLTSLGALALWWAGLMVWQRRNPHAPVLRIAVFGLLAFGWAAGPAWLALDASYLAESPRVLYPTALGIALMWSAPLVALDWRALRTRPIAQRAWTNVIGSAIAIVVAVWSVGWSWQYLAQRAMLFDRMKQAIRSLVLQGHVQNLHPEITQPTLVINFPAWFHVAAPEYALGHDGLTLMSAQHQLDDLYALNENQLVQPRFIAAALPDVQSPAAQYQAFGPVQTVDSLQTELRRSGAIAVTQFVSTSRGSFVALASVGSFGPTATTHSTATFANGVQLITATATPAYDRVLIEFQFQAEAVIPDDTTVFVHVFDQSGQLIAQQDGYPLGGISPLRLWRVGDGWRDSRLIQLPATANGFPAISQVRMGLYRTADGQRVPAFDSAQQRLADDAVPINIVRN